MCILMHIYMCVCLYICLYACTNILTYHYIYMLIHAFMYIAESFGFMETNLLVHVSTNSPFFSIVSWPPSHFFSLFYT